MIEIPTRKNWLHPSEVLRCAGQFLAQFSGRIVLRLDRTFLNVPSTVGTAWYVAGRDVEPLDK